MRILLLIAISALIFTELVQAGSKQEWKKRTVYQLLTDRFYRGNGDVTPCKDLKKYCGGTFSGIKKQISYIKQLGFDAIWISPIPENQGDKQYLFIDPKDSNKITKCRSKRGNTSLANFKISHQLKIKSTRTTTKRLNRWHRHKNLQGTACPSRQRAPAFCPHCISS